MVPFPLSPFLLSCGLLYSNVPQATQADKDLLHIRRDRGSYKHPPQDCGFTQYASCLLRLLQSHHTVYTSLEVWVLGSHRQQHTCDWYKRVMGEQRIQKAHKAETPQQSIGLKFKHGQCSFCHFFSAEESYTQQSFTCTQ